MSSDDSFLAVTSISLMQPPTESPISELGPDAYLELPDNDAFRQAVQLRKGSIKGVILDQVLQKCI